MTTHCDFLIIGGGSSGAVVARRLEQHADVGPLLDDAPHDLVGAAHRQVDGDAGMPRHEAAQAVAHQPVDEALAGDDVDVAALDLLDAVELGQQLLLLAVLAAQVAGQELAGVGGHHAAAAPLNREMMQWFWSHYLKEADHADNPYASPLHADLSGLPPAVVVTAGLDPLRSEGGRYAESLSAAGVPVVHRCYPGAIHGFMTMSGPALAGEARWQAGTDIATALRRAR